MTAATCGQTEPYNREIFAASVVTRRPYNEVERFTCTHHGHTHTHASVSLLILGGPLEVTLLFVAGEVHQLSARAPRGADLRCWCITLTDALAFLLLSPGLLSGCRPKPADESRTQALSNGGRSVRFPTSIKIVPSVPVLPVVASIGSTMSPASPPRRCSAATPIGGVRSGSRY